MKLNSKISLLGDKTVFLLSSRRLDEPTASVVVVASAVLVGVVSKILVGAR